MNVISEKAKSLQGQLIDYRRYLHEHAEQGMELPLTTSFVMTKLKEMGYQPQEICKSGVIALAGGKKPGKTFLLRADMDALPIMERSDLPYKSKTQYMHACGHDLHTAMLLGAAKLLKLLEDEIEGTVKLMFQPAEEHLTGASAMIEAGLLENPDVDAAMMLHVFITQEIPAGTLIITPGGPVMSTSDWFEIRIQGKGCHGAMPETGADPLNVLAHTHLALQAIISRELKPKDFAVITVGQMHGGHTSNVIPDTAYMTGTIRTDNNANREFIKMRMAEITENVAKTFRTSATVEYLNGCPSMTNDADLVEQLKVYSRNVLPEGQMVLAKKVENGAFVMLSGSDDFAFIAEKVPSVMAILSAGSAQEGYNHPLHHPQVRFSEAPLHIGSLIYANTAIEWLKNNK